MERDEPKGGAGVGRATVPLWIKLGLVFGLLMASAQAAFSWLDLQDDLARERERRRHDLMGLASTMATSIDSERLALFRTSTDRERSEWRDMRAWLHGALVDNDVLYAVVLRADDRGRVSYVVVGDEAGPLPPGFPVFDVAPGLLEALAGRLAFTADWRDEWGRYDSAFAPIRDPTGAVVAALELDVDADARDLLTAVRTRRLFRQMGLGLVFSMLVAAAFARYLNRHLGRLTHSALALAGGDLNARADIRTRDEIGLLGRAFDQMVQGLREREFIRETFGRFVEPEVAARVLSDPGGARLGGELRTVTILISDLRGFTSLAESMEPRPLLELLNRYLSRMAEVIHRFGGTINEFTGDGIVAFFGAPEAHADDLPRALACALAMQLELRRFNDEGGRRLQMGIGVESGAVIAGNLGSEQRMKYSVVGDAINLAARLEAAAVGGQVLVTAGCVERAGVPCRVGEPMHLKAKGKREPVTCFPLLGLGAPFDLALPGDTAPSVPVSLRAECWRLEGKMVEERSQVVRVLRLGVGRMLIEGGWSLSLHQHLALAIDSGDGARLTDLYGKVVALEEPAVAGEPWRATVSLTSVPEAAERAIEALIAAHREA